MPWELSARLLAGMLALGLGEECTRLVSITCHPGNRLESPYTAKAAQGRVHECETQLSGRGSRIEGSVLRPGEEV